MYRLEMRMVWSWSYHLMPAPCNRLHCWILWHLVFVRKISVSIVPINIIPSSYAVTTLQANCTLDEVSYYTNQLFVWKANLAQTASLPMIRHAWIAVTGLFLLYDLFTESDSARKFGNLCLKLHKVDESDGTCHKMRKLWQHQFFLTSIQIKVI